MPSPPPKKSKKELAKEAAEEVVLCVPQKFSIAAKEMGLYKLVRERNSVTCATPSVGFIC